MTRLGKDEMGAVLGGIARAQSPIDALVAALDETFMALGAGTIHGAGPKIDGRKWALADDQWRTICQALMDRSGELAAEDGIGRVNLGLDWMNLGPSSETASPDYDAVLPLSRRVA